MEVEPYFGNEQIRRRYEKSWSPLLYSANILGLRLNKKFSLCSFIMLIGASIIFIINFCILLTSIKNADVVLIFVLNIYILFSDIQFSIIFIHFHIKKFKIRERIIKIFCISKGLNWRYKLWIKVIIIWMDFFLFNLCFNIFVMTNNIDNLIMVASLLKLDSFPNVLKTMDYLYHFSCCLFMHTPLCFLFLFFIVICKELEYAFLNLHKDIHISTYNRKKVYNIIMTYFELIEIINTLQDIYSSIFFIWIVSLGSSLLVNLSWFTSLSVDLQNLIYFILLTCVQFYFFLEVCFSSSHITDVCASIGRTFHKISVSSVDPFVQQLCYRFFLSIRYPF